jgi:light-regulated signal transduction histidine kinase (bacteriophytochrome)
VSVFRQRRQAEEDRRVKAELERLVAERTAQLAAANRELEGFSYSISHDLRAPLRAIEGFSQILEEDYGARLDDEGRRLLGVVRDSAKKMSALIDDLLAFSRLGRQAIKPVEIRMDDLAREVFEEILSQAGANRSQFIIHPMPGATGDRALLRQVWMNLLSNAVKYSANREQPVIDVGGQLNGSEAVYYVKDNGAGFDMQYYDKLFSVFQRLHPEEEFSGTGIGLAIVQRVVTRHGGRVWAEGKPGVGAVFYFSLPKGDPGGRLP